MLAESANLDRSWGWCRDVPLFDNTEERAFMILAIVREVSMHCRYCHFDTSTDRHSDYCGLSSEKNFDLYHEGVQCGLRCEMFYSTHPAFFRGWVRGLNYTFDNPQEEG